MPAVVDPCWPAPAARCSCICGIVVVVGAAVRAACRRRSCPTRTPAFMYGQVQTPPGASKERTWAALDAGAEVLPRPGEGHRRRRADGRRLQLRRHRPELRPRCSSSSRTGTSARKPSQSDAGARWRRADAVLLERARTRVIIAVRAAGRHGARQRDRLRHDAAESRRPVARGVPRGAQSAARRGRQGSRGSSRCGPNGVEDAPQFKLDIDREKASALGLSHRRHQPDAHGRLGVQLRERLHRPRPRQARLRAGRARTRACSPRT